MNEHMPSIPRSFVKAAFKRPRPHVAALPAAAVTVAGVRQSRERLLAYQRLCGFPIRDVAPVTWLHVLTFPMQIQLMAADPFPFAAAGTIHLANSLTQLRPVCADEVLDLRVSQGNLRSHPKGAVFDMRCAASIDGQVVWRGTSTYLARTPSVDAEPVALPRRDAPAAATPQRWRLPADLGRRYAAVSGDINPIHLSWLSARAFGFKRPIIHGMWTHARALAALGPLVPDEFDVSVSFAKPLALPGGAHFVVERGEHLSFAVVSRDGARTYLVGELR